MLCALLKLENIYIGKLRLYVINIQPIYYYEFYHK